MNIDLIFYTATFAFVVFSGIISSGWKKNALIFIQISLLVFYNPVSNKILAAVTIAHLVYMSLFRIRSLLKIKGALILVLISLLMLYGGTTALQTSTSIDHDKWASVVLSPIVTGPLLAISILAQMRNVSDIYHLLETYAFARMLETAIVGILIYALFQNELQLLTFFLDGYARLDFDETRRLISISSRNANEAAFLLLPAAILFFHKLKDGYRYKIYFVITFFAIILTWTRSAILLFLAYMLFSDMKLNGMGVQKIALKMMAIIFIAMSFVIFSLFATPDRLFTFETIDIRLTQYIEYFNGLGKLNLMSGIIDDIWTKNKILSLTYNISSENVFMEFLYKYGLIPGGAIILFNFFILIRSSYYLSSMNSFAASDSMILCYYRLVIGVNLIMFLMANTTSFEQTSVMWITGLLALNMNWVYQRSSLNGYMMNKSIWQERWLPGQSRIQG